MTPEGAPSLRAGTDPRLSAPALNDQEAPQVPAAPRRRPERGTKPAGRPGPCRQPGATAGPDGDQSGREARAARSPGATRDPGRSASPARCRPLRGPRSAPELSGRATRSPLP